MPVLYQLPCPVTGLEAGAEAGGGPSDPDPKVASPTVAEAPLLRVAGKAASPSSSARLLLVSIVLHSKKAVGSVLGAMT